MLCKPKKEGGLGFKDLAKFNDARPNKCGDLFMIKTHYFIVFLSQSTFPMVLFWRPNNHRVHLPGKAF